MRRLRGWVLWIAIVALVGIGAGFGGYQLGLRNAPKVSLATSTSAAGSPSPAGSTSPAPSIPHASPTPQPPGAAALHCKLPVYTLGQKGSGAFLSFPDGALTPDPTSQVTDPEGDWFGLTYDTVAKRWVPVPSTWVTPDGSIYVYALDFDPHAGATQLMVVNAITDNSSMLGGGNPWQVIGVSPTLIYLTSFDSGVYIQTIAGPYQPQYVGDGHWSAASGDYIYGSSVPDGGAIVRMDARDTSKRVAWFNKSTSAVILGFDGSGDPVIWTGSDIWIATAPDHATRIAGVTPLPSPTASGHPIRGALSPIADSHGLWFSGTDGIYLFSQGLVTKVSNTIAQVAGPCT